MRKTMGSTCHITFLPPRRRSFHRLFISRFPHATSPPARLAPPVAPPAVAPPPVHRQHYSRAAVTLALRRPRAATFCTHAPSAPSTARTAAVRRSHATAPASSAPPRPLRHTRATALHHHRSYAPPHCTATAAAPLTRHCVARTPPRRCVLDTPSDQNGS
jgi:hypothetical protein